jgi:hypothetical protein
MVTSFAQRNMFSKAYTWYRTVYKPAKYKRLGNYSASHRLAREQVRMTWMLQKSAIGLKPPPKVFVPPKHPFFENARKYNEVEYQLFTVKLRMEFYFQVLDLYCRPGDAVLSVFTGTKAVYASVVSVYISLSDECHTLTRYELKCTISHYLFCYCYFAYLFDRWSVLTKSIKLPVRDCHLFLDF